jgi:hypothetical protein
VKSVESHPTFRENISPPPAFTLVSSLAYSYILKIEVTCYSETSVEFQRIIRCYTPENSLFGILYQLPVTTRRTSFVCCFEMLTVSGGYTRLPVKHFRGIDTSCLQGFSTVVALVISSLRPRNVPLQRHSTKTEYDWCKNGSKARLGYEAFSR